MTVGTCLGPFAETSLVKHAGTIRDELERSVEEVQQLHAKIGESACLQKLASQHEYKTNDCGSLR